MPGAAKYVKCSNVLAMRFLLLAYRASFSSAKYEAKRAVLGPPLALARYMHH
jgi:hypothetical protein